MRRLPLPLVLVFWLAFGLATATAQTPNRLRAAGDDQGGLKQGGDLESLLIGPNNKLDCNGFAEPWPGINCKCPDGEGRNQQCEVVTIYLNSSGLAGTLPEQLAALTSLQVLNLSNNLLTGTDNLTGPLLWSPDSTAGDDTGQLPLPALVMLDLGQNGFDGLLRPARGVRRVEYLALDQCNFSGPLPPDFLDGVGGLQEVWLSDNQLEGPLPPEWAMSDAAASLRVLRLNNNRLVGTLPWSWSRFAQLQVLSLQENALAGPVPLEWARRWSSQANSSASPAMQLGVWPGNPGLCGPVWGAQASPSGDPVVLPSLLGADKSGKRDGQGGLAFSATMFIAQATPASLPGTKGANLSAGVSEDELALRLSNSLGSCALPCTPTTTAKVATNVYDLAAGRGLGLHAMLRANSPVALAAANSPGQVVVLPCPGYGNMTDEAAPYLGGDLAYMQAAMCSSAAVSYSRLLQVASVVATPPGQPPLWGSFSSGPAPGPGQEPFWAVDLGASLEVSVILVTPNQRMPQLSIYVGDNDTDVLSNRLCLRQQGAGWQANAPVPLLMPPNCRGRYVILSGLVHLRDVQVYPALANAAANKPVSGSSGANSSTGSNSSSLTDGDLGSCLTLPARSGNDTQTSQVWAAVDLKYSALVGVVRVLSKSRFTGLQLSLSNSSGPLVPPSPLINITSTPLDQSGSLFGGVATLMGTAQYIVLQWQPSSPAASLDLCEVGAFLAQGPAKVDQEMEEGGGSSGDGSGGSKSNNKVGVIVGATIGGVLGLAALTACLACCSSYRTWRRTQRQHSKLAAQLASTQAASMAGGVESKDGLVAAAALQAMTQAAPHRTELQLLRSYVSMRLRTTHDSVGSLCSCCWAPGPGRRELPRPQGSTGSSLSPTDSSGISSRRRLLPLYYLSRGQRRAGGGFGSVAGLDASVDARTPSGTDASEKLQDDGTPPPPGQQQQGVAGDIELGTLASAPPVAQLSSRLSSALGGLVDYHEIELGRFLGDGSFGSVHLARWKHVQVAVKVLQRIDPKLLHAASAGLGSKVTRSGRIAEETLKELAKEAGIMASLRHPCVVSYIGACLEPPCLIMEYCARGSVYGVLSGAAEDAQAAAMLTWPRLMRFAWDASKGMLYLHTLRPPIVHRDLKSANLLVDGNWHVKVSDFNLSRVMEPASTISTLSTANPRWMSPEVIKGETPTLAADVFAFGVVLWELMTWQLPWSSDKNPFQIANLVTAGARLDVPARDQLPAGELPVYDEYVALMRACWDQDQEARPTFDSIVTSLQSMTVKVVQSSRKQL